MDVRHFLKIYNENGDDGVIRMIRSRSFDDINFKRFYQGEKKFSLASLITEKIEFSPNEILYLENNPAYVHDYQFDDEEDKASRKQRIVSENQELPWAVSEMGELATTCGRYNVERSKLDEQVARLSKATLRSADGKVVVEADFENGGLSLKEINDFCNSVLATHSAQPYLSFTQITNQLLAGFEGQDFAKNYNELAKVLLKVNKFKNIKSRSAQLSFDLLGNIVCGSEPKQKH